MTNVCEGSNAIKTLDLTRRYGRVAAVDGVNLDVPARSVFGLVGPNGAGKTTTIKLLMNLVRPTRGSAFVLGEPSRRLGPRTFQRIGYVSENQRLPDYLTPARLLHYCRPFYPTWDDAWCRRLQTDLRLSMDASLRTASRGARMKAALLVALAYRPELIVLDEPFSGLDPLVRDELSHALLQLAGNQPVTILVSSHDVEELERLVDWIGFLDNGRLAFAEQTSSLLKRFRLVEIVAVDQTPPSFSDGPDWVLQGVFGRVLKFIDTRHDAPDAMAHIAAAYPGAEIRTAGLSLREIFVMLARRSSPEAVVSRGR